VLPYYNRVRKLTSVFIVHNTIFGMKFGGNEIVISWSERCPQGTQRRPVLVMPAFLPFSHGVEQLEEAIILRLSVNLLELNYTELSPLPNVAVKSIGALSSDLQIVLRFPQLVHLALMNIHQVQPATKVFENSIDSTPYHYLQTMVDPDVANIPAGGELFTVYGDHWFEGRERFAGLANSQDYLQIL
jgi:hypothetical protein